MGTHGGSYSEPPGPDQAVRGFNVTTVLMASALSRQLAAR
jgi:hypothetical protein